jgi:hypothetical protein
MVIERVRDVFSLSELGYVFWSLLEWTSHLTSTIIQIRSYPEQEYLLLE